MTNYHEPWTVEKSRLWKKDFEGGPPTDCDPEHVGRWEGERERAERDAPVYVMGSGIWAPQICKNLSGDITASSEDGILFKVFRVPTKHGHIDQYALAKRIVACVNYCAGVNDLDDVPPLPELIGLADESERLAAKRELNTLWRSRQQ